MLVELLEKSKLERKIISFRNYHDEDNFWCGYVKDYNDEFVIIQHISKLGKLDGVIVEKLSALESLEFDDEYAACMEYVVKNTKLLELQIEIEPEITLNENWQTDVLEEYVANENIIVRLTILDENIYSGIIRWMNEHEILLNIIGNLGEDKGKAILKIEDISQIRINDIQNRKKLLLYKWRKTGMK